jgi:NADH:ubiquinone oxidoreductase subunit E
MMADDTHIAVWLTDAVVPCFTFTDAHRDRLERELGVGVGETTSDGKFTLETVRCVGCCGLAPVVAVGDAFYGNLNSSKAARLVEQLAQQPASQST